MISRNHCSEPPVCGAYSSDKYYTIIVFPASLFLRMISTRADSTAQYRGFIYRKLSYSNATIGVPPLLMTRSSLKMRRLQMPRG